MTYSEIITKRITELCEQRGLSNNKLAKMSDVGQSTIDNIKHGNTNDPRLRTIHKIANGFNMTVSEFLDFKEMNEFSFDE